MTHAIHPLSDQRKRRPGDVLKDGEALHFSVNLIDSASGSARFFTDAEYKRDIRAQVDREHAAHDHKFAFMGDRAPAFDRERAEFLARTKFGAQPGMAGTTTTDADRTRALAAGRYNTSAPLVDAEARPKAGARISTHDAGGQATPAAVNALRLSRYQG